MHDGFRKTILALMDQHRVMTIATVRPDGWPQATTVGYAHEGLTLYFLCGPGSQKAANLARDDRVSITIDHDTPQVMEIRALSMAARARRITDPAECARIMALLISRYPQQEGAAASMTLPDPAALAIFRVDPVVVSVIDYARGFGHADLIEV